MLCSRIFYDVTNTTINCWRNLALVSWRSGLRRASGSLGIWWNPSRRNPFPPLVDMDSSNSTADSDSAQVNDRTHFASPGLPLLRCAAQPHTTFPAQANSLDRRGGPVPTRLLLLLLSHPIPRRRRSHRRRHWRNFHGEGRTIPAGKAQPTKPGGTTGSAPVW